jgi:hypothetical protein
LPDGFSEVEDLIGDGQEVALVISVDEGTGSWRLESYSSLPMEPTLTDIEFSYLSACTNLGPDISTVLYSQSLYQSAPPTDFNPSSDNSAINSTFNSNIFETYAATKKKYKPVSQKVRPVLGDLPEKFRIVRNIEGDPAT